MKKTLIAVSLIVGTLSAYPQGTVFFLDRQSDVTIHIFAPQVATPGVETTGDQGAPIGSATAGVTPDLYDNNNSDGNYAGGSTQGAGTSGVITTGGSTVYTGGAIGNTLAGFATPAGAFNYNNGSDYTVELYAAPGNNVALSALSAVSQYVSTMVTSSTTGGTWKTITVNSDPGIPNTASGLATIALYAWYNGGVAPTSLTGAQLTAQLAADQNPATAAPWGASPTDNLGSLGGVGGPPAATTGDMIGLESFSLIVPTPEPSTIALGVIGASTSLFRRRK